LKKNYSNKMKGRKIKSREMKSMKMKSSWMRSAVLMNTRNTMTLEIMYMKLH
jgi:hypothetical protein